MKAEDLRLLHEGKNLVFEEYISETNFFTKLLIHSVALANSSGGSIIFGVNKNYEVTGCPFINSVRIVDYIYKNTSPSLLSAANNIKISDLPCKKNNIICIEVYPKKPYISTSSGEIYIRENMSSVNYFKDINILMDNIQNDSSCHIVKEVEGKDINFPMIKKYKDRFKRLNKNSGLLSLPDMSFLKALGSITEINGKTMLTNTGLFLFGSSSTIEKYAPFFGIKYTFSENNRQNRTYFFGNGNISDVINKVSKEIQENLRTLREYENLPQVLLILFLYVFTYQDYEKESYVNVTYKDGCLEVSYMGNCVGGTVQKNYALPIPVQRNLLLSHALKKLKIAGFSVTGYSDVFEQMLKDGFECPKFPPMDRKTKIILNFKKRDIGFMEFYKMIRKKAKRNLSFYEIAALKLRYKSKDLTSKKIMEETSLKKRSAEKVCEKINVLVHDLN